jgi:predicted TPR repeat methyltransferase
MNALYASLPDVRELVGRVAAMLDRGRPGAARPLLNAALCSAPASAELMDLEARLLQSEGRAADALALLDRAVAAFPEAGTIRLSRAQARLHAGDARAAADDAAEAVVLDPRGAHGKALLGAALLELGYVADACACLAEALRAEPACASYRQSLACAQERGGDVAGACACLEQGIALQPDHVGLRISAILLRIRLRDFAGADDLAEAARRWGAADARVFGLQGHARSSLGRHDAAADAYEDARKLAAEDPYVRHLAAAAGLAHKLPRATREYVKTVFDGYAPRFDAHLIELGYRVPGLCRQALASRPRPGPGAGPALDLGCGTGLLAVVAADLLTGPLIGVDLSAAMLAQAKGRDLYAELHEADVEDFLDEDKRRYDLVMAGDVLPYFGDLSGIVRSVASHLTGSACFMFSLEELPETAMEADGWRLGWLGRYAHTQDHVILAAAQAGLTVAAMRREVIRVEDGVPVQGLFVVLQARAA